MNPDQTGTAISDATPADVPDLVHLINAAYRAPGERPGWTDERHLLEGPRTSLAMVRDDLAVGRIRMLRRAAGEPVAACLHVAVATDGAWYLSSIAVDPARQNAGLGAALLADIEGEARAAGAPCLRMTVIQVRDSLIAWYERRGFRRTGRTVAFPYDQPGVGRPLRADLALVVLEKAL